MWRERKEAPANGGNRTPPLENLSRSRRMTEDLSTGTQKMPEAVMELPVDGQHTLCSENYEKDSSAHFYISVLRVTVKRLPESVDGMRVMGLLR